MRKLLVVMLVIVLAITSAIALVACGGDVDLPGRKWTNKEVLSYEIYEGETKIGALVITTERIGSGEQTLNATGDKHVVSASSVKGTRVTMAASDLNGNIMMASESILDGFTTLASYKQVKYNGADYVVKARYDGKRYRYSINGGEEEKIKVKTGFVDNELLYTVLRCYSIEDSYTGTYTVIDAVAGTKQNLSISTSNADARYNGTPYQVEGATVNQIKVVTGDGAVSYVTNVKCVELQIAKSDAPIGSPIFVSYSVEGTDGLSVLGEGATGNSSTHIPVRIKENNLTYILASIECK
ncbi:MAG: hypothetical protein J6V83_04255 [Clostridia bacterium]|nr:hypothetical protein [Clostridia bacterium]